MKSINHSLTFQTLKSGTLNDLFLILEVSVLSELKCQYKTTFCCSLLVIFQP